MPRNSASLSRNRNAEENIISINNKIRDSAFGEIRVANRTNLIDLKSSFGLNNLRDLVETTGSGSVTNVIESTGQYTISTTASGADAASLSTRERGRYTAGIECESGIAFRLGDLDYNGNEFARFGYYDDQNGYFFQYDSNGLRCFVRKGASDTEVPILVDLNRLKNGNKIARLDLLEGHIWNISIVWYGYGNITFFVNINNTPYTLATFDPGRTGTSTLTANLPIRAEIDNNGTATAHDIFVAGRQFSFIGDYSPTLRITPIVVLSKSIPTTNAGSTDSSTPIFSIERKTPNTTAQIKIFSIEVISDEDILLQIFLDTTLVGSSYTNIPNIDTSDTLLEYDISATDFTTPNDLLIYSALIAGGTFFTGNGFGNPNTPILFDLNGSQNITVVARALSATASVNIVVQFQEEF